MWNLLLASEKEAKCSILVITFANRIHECHSEDMLPPKASSLKRVRDEEEGEEGEITKEKEKKAGRNRAEKSGENYQKNSVSTSPAKIIDLMPQV